MTKKRTRAQRNIAWIETFLRVPEGKFVGQKVKLRPWQRKIIAGIYTEPPQPKIRRAIISFARKNAKTALSAMLLLLHLVGPEKRYNSQLYSTGLTREQAAVLFGLAAKMVRMSPDLAHAVIVRDTAKQLVCQHLGTTYRALSSDAPTALGLSPIFTVHDELGQVKGARSDLYDALETATGAQDDPLSIIISTQAATNDDLLSILIDDALAGNDPHTRLFLWTADLELDPFSVQAIRQANPAYGDFLNADEVRAQAANAQRMPSLESGFRNLILNQRVDASSPFISRRLWESCAGSVLDDFDGLDVFAGLDLSSVNDLTSFVMIAKPAAKWQVKPTFWLPEEGVRERSTVDRVPYDLWKRDEFLHTTPGHSIEYEWIAAYLREMSQRYSIRRIAFDRWNFRHLKPWLIHAGFYEEEIEEKFVEFGQGYQSMSPALRDLEGLILNGNLEHDGHPILAMCAANAVVQMDPAGNRKLTKAKSHGRIDGMIALAMAVSVAITNESEPEPQMLFI